VHDGIDGGIDGLDTRNGRLEHIAGADLRFGDEGRKAQCVIGFGLTSACVMGWGDINQSDRR
jgi:hypothetical protein